MGIHGITNSQVVEKVVKWQQYMDHNRANTLAFDLHFDEFFRSLNIDRIFQKYSKLDSKIIFWKNKVTKQFKNDKN